MKKNLILLAAAILAMGCNTGDDDWRTNKRAVRVVCDFEGPQWNALVDSEQSGGPLLYGGVGYGWHDEATDLASELTNLYGDNNFWGGGVALSSYLTTDYTTAGTADKQLTVFAESMFSGSNCIICYGTNSAYGDCRPYIYFKNEPRYIESAWVAQTSYLHAMATDGMLGTLPIPALTAKDSIWIVATGYTLDSEGNEVEGSSIKFYLYENGATSFNGWRLWDLSPLGKVKRVKFDVQWNGEGAFCHPGYFALDDITAVYIK